MERLFQRRSIARISFKVEAPIRTPQRVLSQTPSSIDHIVLEFKVQVICSHFRVEQNNDILLVRMHKYQRIPFVAYQLPVKIFNHRDATLQQFLSTKLRRYRNVMNHVKLITDEIINKWIKIKSETTNLRFGKDFSFVILLKLWNVATRRSRSRPSFMDISGNPMIPTSKTAIEMLRRVSIEEIDTNQMCVICLEKIEEGAILLLQMPCSHVFHEECIKTWLSNSHYCPICRFDLSTQ